MHFLLASGIFIDTEFVGSSIGIYVVSMTPLLKKLR